MEKRKQIGYMIGVFNLREIIIIQRKMRMQKAALIYMMELRI
ncbi:hypothetical protein C823_005397 [Eubacterium plexicaudatum ASF492]|nr:hypothetical protein C823_005397 [Eubacterium plexicaudatum ASF492]